MNLITVDVSIKASEEIRGLWKTLEVQVAEGTSEYCEDWHNARAQLYRELVRTPKLGRKPKNLTSIDHHYQTLRTNMQNLFKELHLAA